MPVPAMAEPHVDHQKRFQAAVDVIHNLPKNGSYRPSYEVMLRFYGLYKQAVCGPCTVTRPGFWDPVGRYKWDAWRHLGEMSREVAMAAYVDEMKKVAQEVIDTMPVDEKTASLFHHFEPLYHVIDDMPRPPDALLTLTDAGQPSSPSEGLEPDHGPEGLVDIHEDEARPAEAAAVDPGSLESEDGPGNENTVPNENLLSRPKIQAKNKGNSGVSEGLLLTSDSENEIFCDSVDSVEQLGPVKVPLVKSNGIQNGHVSAQDPPVQNHQRLQARQAGAGHGGEGAEDGKGPNRGSRDGGREPSHSWRERGIPQGSMRRGGPGGAGRGGGDGSEGGAERLHDAQLQQQIILALQRLREDMRSVMERLEVVEQLTATYARSSETRCGRCSAAASQQEKRRPLDASTPTILLFLLWPFVAHGLIYLLRKGQRRRRGVSS